jgi:deoxyribose-phosphate aldolase
MVMDVGALRTGDLMRAYRDIDDVVRVCRDIGAGLKVIIEAALLDQREKITACTLAQGAGADFVKTSTGFGPGGATTQDVALMRHVVGGAMGVKASGGIRTLESLRAMVRAGATRIGASAGVQIMAEAQGAQPAPDRQS